jgi:hypothetical protein
MERTTAFGIALICLILLLSILSPRKSSNVKAPPSTNVTEAPAAPPTVKQQTADDDALRATAIILRAVNDPDSVAVDEARVTEKAICITFRAKNAFNALMRADVVITRDFKDGAFSWENGFDRKWNSKCVNQSATDATRTVRGNLKYNRRWLMKMADR